MKGPQAFAPYLAENLYHPRSDAHSNAICRLVLEDLIGTCGPLAELAEKGRIVATLNHTVVVNYSNWNIDLAIGPPSAPPGKQFFDLPIYEGAPVEVQLAVEAKGIMTEHGKARRNRLRDFHAFHAHAHQYNPKVVAGGIVAINCSKHFWSPTRDVNDITIHKNLERMVPETIDIFRSIPLRNSENDQPGLEAFGVVVVDHDNLRKNPLREKLALNPATTEVVTKPPAPQPGEPLHWGTMIYRLCSSYRSRWL